MNPGIASTARGLSGQWLRRTARLVLFGLAAFLAPSLVAAPAASADPIRVLVFSKTVGFRHDSIPVGIETIRALGAANGFAVDATEDSTQFNDANLSRYAALIFLCTIGDIFDDSQKAALRRYIGAGGGYVGIHSASDTEHSWPWYGELVGAYFSSHPAIQPATIKLADRVHPSTQDLPDRWNRTDEWYNFNANPRGRVHVLATLDESTYSGGVMGFDHPIAWCHYFAGGRAWYTGGGHTSAAYSEPLFQQHLLGGILWAAGIRPGDAGATIDANFRKVVLNDSTLDPMELAVAPDGRVFFIERAGAVKIIKPESRATVLAGSLDVFDQLEDGLLGIALDPGFATNQWLYLFYSPAGPIPEQRVARFTVAGDALDLSAEKILLRIPTQRDQCCHSAGSLAFGPGGNLFVSTGDNTNPFESDGYAPIDERPGRAPWDAQKSASNANDLRGKILRIQPTDAGAYAIPDGNLFPKDGAAGRPEIYAMGCRNPFRISVDQETGWLYWGEVGPDSHVANPARGPAGYDEWNQARAAGNFGWPYFIADNKPYIDYDFATGLSGAAFDPESPVNHSPNNTGPTALPPAQPAWIWYPYADSVEFPQVNQGSGRTAMAGPTYHFNPALVSPIKLPAYYDRAVFIYEWSRNWIREIQQDTAGNILSINPFLPSLSFARPMDMELGPDGALYLIEWGTGFTGGNSDSKIVRLEYLGATTALQSSGNVAFGFASDPAAQFDPGTQTFRTTLPATPRFYRVRSPSSAVIRSISIKNSQLEIQIGSNE